VNGVIGVLRGCPVLRPGTVSTIAGPVRRPNFCTAIMNLFIGLSQAGGFGSDMSSLPC
jgi:hypothetical protein